MSTGTRPALSLPWDILLVCQVCLEGFVLAPRAGGSLEMELSLHCCCSRSNFCWEELTVFDLWCVSGSNWAYGWHQGCRGAAQASLSPAVPTPSKLQPGQLQQVPEVLISRVCPAYSRSVWECWWAAPVNSLDIWAQGRFQDLSGLSEPLTSIPSVFAGTPGELLLICTAELEPKPLCAPCNSPLLPQT